MTLEENVLQEIARAEAAADADAGTAETMLGALEKLGASARAEGLLRAADAADESRRRIAAKLRAIAEGV